MRVREREENWRGGMEGTLCCRLQIGFGLALGKGKKTRKRKGKGKEEKEGKEGNGENDVMNYSCSQQQERYITVRPVPWHDKNTRD